AGVERAIHTFEDVAEESGHPFFLRDLPSFEPSNCSITEIFSTDAFSTASQSPLPRWVRQLSRPLCEASKRSLRESSFPSSMSSRNSIRAVIRRFNPCTTFSRLCRDDMLKAAASPSSPNADVAEKYARPATLRTSCQPGWSIVAFRRAADV